MREELIEARSLIEKYSSTKDEAKCARCAAALLTTDEQVQGVVVEKKKTVTISQLEQDLKSPNLLFESGYSPQNASSTGSPRDELENGVQDCHETSKTQGEQPSGLEHSSSCILKLNFTQEEDQRADDGSSLKTTERHPQTAQLMKTELQENQNLQGLSGNNMNIVDLDTVRVIRSLLEEIVKLKAHVITAEQTTPASKWNSSELVKELLNSILVIQAVQEERKKWAAQNEALLKEMDTATRARQEGEAATSRLLEHLYEGEHALTDAVREMEGILDDSLSQPTALDRVQEREHLNVQQLDMTTPDITSQKHADQVKQEGEHAQVNSIKRSFSICTTMLSWFSETLSAESTTKDTLMTLNERAMEELGKKDSLILSLQSQLERASVYLFDRDSLVSKLQYEQGRNQERLREADAQAGAAANVHVKLLDDIEKLRLEVTTVSKRMEDSELELAQVQDVLTDLKVELIGCERKREELAVEREQLAAEVFYEREIFERSCTVSATMVWWLQNKLAADEEAQKLNSEEISFRVSERDRMVMNQSTEDTMMPEDHMKKREILINHNSEHMQEVNDIRDEIAAKDSLLGDMQTNILRLQEELSASEDLSLHLAMEKEKLQMQLSECAQISKALEGELSRVQTDLQAAEVKVVELAIVQAGMLIVQEEWGLGKQGLEREAREAKQRCTQLQQELERTHNLSQKFEVELEEAHTQETVLREEKGAALINLEEELRRAQISAEAFKDQVSKIDTYLIFMCTTSGFLFLSASTNRFSSSCVFSYSRCSITNIELGPNVCSLS